MGRKGITGLSTQSDKIEADLVFPIKKSYLFFSRMNHCNALMRELGPIHNITLKAFSMGPSVKHVLGVLEWSYVVPETLFFFFKSRVWFGVTSSQGPQPLLW